MMKTIKCRCPECCTTFTHRVPHDEDEAVIKLAQSFELCDTCKEIAEDSKPQAEEEIDIEIRRLNFTLLDWQRIKKTQWMQVRDLLDVIQESPEHFSRMSLGRAFESDGGDRTGDNGDEEFIMVTSHHPRSKLDELTRQLHRMVNP